MSVFDLDAPIVPGKSAAGVQLGQPIEEITAQTRPRSVTQTIESAKYDFGCVSLWMRDGKIDQIGLHEGYRGALYGVARIGTRLSEIEDRLGPVHEDDLKRLCLLGDPGWSFVTAPPLNADQVRANPEARIAAIRVHEGGQHKTALRIAWRKEWLSCLFEFASIAFQRGSWIEGKHMGDLAESMCGYFDDLNLGDGYQSAIDENLVSQEEATIVSRFHDLAQDYDAGRKTAAEILEDERWQEVVREAAKAWNSLRAIAAHPEDCACMDYLEERFGKVPTPE